MEAHAINLRSVAQMERKHGREELARVIEGAADEIERLRAAMNSTIRFIADLERHGTIDHAVAAELMLHITKE